jgi:hypothetical protein
MDDIVKLFGRGASASAKGRRPRCPICATPAPRRKVVRNRQSGRELTVRICQTCGHVKVLRNKHDYTQTESIADLGQGLAPRFGTENTPGREFGMAKLAAEVLGRNRLDVLVFGAGRSLDNRHIEQLPNVRRVAIGDLMRVRDEPDFVDTGQPAKETFDIVVACEVIEHFTRPQKDFAHLFDYVHRAGILVCSTNIYDGGDLTKQSYIFGRGHVAYYSPEALRRIAKANKMHVDFRLPAAATGSAGRRKRYVIFSHSRDVMDAVSDYFGRTPYAPSEKPVKRSREDHGRRPAAHAAGQADKHPIALG